MSQLMPQIVVARLQRRDDRAFLAPDVPESAGHRPRVHAPGHRGTLANRHHRADHQRQPHLQRAGRALRHRPVEAGPAPMLGKARAEGVSLRTSQLTVKLDPATGDMVSLRRAGLEVDPFTGKAHTLYSLRHTAICMRIINSHGKVNIFNLAKNAGTSVDQIERFYAKYLPLSKEMAKNLQSFGE